MTSCYTYSFELVLWFVVKDLQSFVCKSVKEIEHVMNVGNQNRAVGYVCESITLSAPLFALSNIILIIYGTKCAI